MKKLIFLFALILPIAGWAMADHTPPVYGRPTLYGEYEITGSDVARASGMYGDVPHAAPIRVAHATKTPAAKHPVSPKKATPKARKSSVRAAKVKATLPKKTEPSVEEIKKEEDVPPADTAAKEAEEKTVMVEAAPVSEPAPVAETNIPGQYADSIKGALSNKYDVSSYCVPRPAGAHGALPDGFILMPGRPDLMSCTDNK